MLGYILHKFERGLQILCFVHQFFFAEHGQLLHFFHNGPNVADRLDDIAGAGFAFGTDHSGAFCDAAQRLAQIARTTDKWHFEVVLINVVLFVRRREHFAFINVIDAQYFENASFGEMSDAYLCHDRYRNGRHDVANHANLRHARHAAFLTYIGGDAFERHDGCGAGLLGNARVVGIHHIHDHPAFQHFGQTDLQPELIALKVHFRVLLRCHLHQSRHRLERQVGGVGREFGGRGLAQNLYAAGDLFAR